MTETPPRPDSRLVGVPPMPVPAVEVPDRGTSRLAALPPVSWRWWQGVIAYLVVGLVIGQVLVAGVIAVVFSIDLTSAAADGGTIAITIAANFVTVAGLAWWLRRRHPGATAALGFGPAGARLKEFAIGYGLGLVLYLAVAFGVGLFLTLVFQALFGDQVTVPEQISSDLSSAGRAGAVVLALIVAPVTEELFYRGILFRSVRDRRGFWPGALVSALVFGLVHYVPAPWQDALLLQSVMVFTGFGLSLIYERRGSMIANIAAHMGFNTIGILLIFAG
jgi:membrane protease YdiL (CAAX protease family)